MDRYADKHRMRHRSNSDFTDHCDGDYDWDYHPYNEYEDRRTEHDMIPYDQSYNDDRPAHNNNYHESRPVYDNKYRYERSRDHLNQNQKDYHRRDRHPSGAIERIHSEDPNAGRVTDLIPFSTDARPQKRLSAPIVDRNKFVAQYADARHDQFTTIKQLNIFTGTWNVNGQRPTISIKSWLFPNPGVPLYDIYFISFQEVQPLSGMNAVTTDVSRGNLWKNLVFTTLQEHPNSPGYSVLGSRQMVGILLLVIAKNNLRDIISNFRITDVGTGFLSKGGNKGGVVSSFLLGGISVACVSCHLAAHEQNVDKRNQDFHDIMRKADLVSFATTQAASLHDHDVILWLGDMNYRIDRDVESVLNLIRLQDWAKLREFDQLNISRKNNQAFIGFHEGSLDFAPTYKLSPNDSGYLMNEEGGLKRTPAWCDRILWKVKNGAGIHVVQYSYGSRPDILSSDHRPVYAEFSLKMEVIDQAQKRAVLAEAHRLVDSEEMKRKPSITISDREIIFKSIIYEHEQERYVDIKNTGFVPVVFFINSQETPDWLFVSVPSESTKKDYTIHPGMSVKLRVRVFIGSNTRSIRNLNASDSVISHTLRINVVDGGEFFMYIEGSYQKTCFSSSLEVLTKTPKEQKGKNYGPNGIPLELWLLGDALMIEDECKQPKICDKETFSVKAKASDIAYIRTFIDRWDPIPKQVSGMALGSCLVEFLDTLAEPVIPPEALATVKAAIDTRSPSKAYEAIAPCSVARRNAMNYICALLMEIPEVSDDLISTGGDIPGNAMSLKILGPIASALFQYKKNKSISEYYLSEKNIQHFIALYMIRIFQNYVILLDIKP